jgi:hypothetical protein
MRGYFTEYWPEDGSRPKLVKLTPRMRGVLKGIFALAEWAQQWMAWPSEYNGAGGKVGEWLYESDVVHRPRLHPETNRFGYHGTPTSCIATQCQLVWKSRPRRSFLQSRVTCPTCLCTYQTHPETNDPPL